MTSFYVGETVTYFPPGAHAPERGVIVSINQARTAAQVLYFGDRTPKYTYLKDLRHD